VKKILEKGRAPIKELLQHLEKEKQSGGRKKKQKVHYYLEHSYTSSLRPQTLAA
jgi:hypothetical protein